MDGCSLFVLFVCLYCMVNNGLWVDFVSTSGSDHDPRREALGKAREGKARMDDKRPVKNGSDDLKILWRTRASLG